MKKIIISTLALFLIFSTSVLGQQKQVEVYTTIKKAKFIPLINNKPMTTVAVDTFIYKVETTQIVNLTIDFVDVRFTDIFIPIDFDGIKHQKYQIIYKNNRKKTAELIKNTPKNDTLLDLFTLKNESFKNYLKTIND